MTIVNYEKRSQWLIFCFTDLNKFNLEIELIR